MTQGPYSDLRQECDLSGLSSATERHHYVMANGTRVALIVTSDTVGRSARYTHQNRLGSVAAVTDEQGAILVRYFYDPYGRSVDEQGQPLGNGQRSNVTPRRFTDHEHLDEVGLIHANARVLDPLVGQFLSVDPVMGAASPQSLDPYAYVRNSPLSMTDPSGMYAFGIGPLVFVGHSLGGGLAIVGAIATGSDAYVFDSAGINSRTLAGLVASSSPHIFQIRSGSDLLRFVNFVTPTSSPGAYIGVQNGGYHPIAPLCAALNDGGC